MAAPVLRLRRRWRNDDGSELRAWGDAALPRWGKGCCGGGGGDAVCPGGAKALLCGAPDFGGFTGKSMLWGGLPFRKGWQARREDGGRGSAVGKGWIYTSYAGHAVLWVKTRPFPTERSVSPTRSEDRLSAPPATAIFPRHPAGRTAGSARTRPRDQSHR